MLAQKFSLTRNISYPPTLPMCLWRTHGQHNVRLKRLRLHTLIGQTAVECLKPSNLFFRLLPLLSSTPGTSDPEQVSSPKPPRRPHATQSNGSPETTRGNLKDENYLREFTYQRYQRAFTSILGDTVWLRGHQAFEDWAPNFRRKKQNLSSMGSVCHASSTALSVHDEDPSPGRVSVCLYQGKQGSTAFVWIESTPTFYFLFFNYYINAYPGSSCTVQQARALHLQRSRNRE